VSRSRAARTREATKDVEAGCVEGCEAGIEAACTGGGDDGAEGDEAGDGESSQAPQRAATDAIEANERRRTEAEGNHIRGL